MNIQIAEVTQVVEQFAPPSLQESYDNSGLITGRPDWQVTGILLTLDCTEAIVDEAISLGYNLIVAHHPIVFSGLKKINGNTYVERVIIKAIKNDIAIYACHTNLDNVFAGVNNKIAQKLGLTNLQILAPMAQRLQQMYFYVPNQSANMVRDAIFAAGGGAIGNYTECSFNTEGFGTFKPNNFANPKIGQAGGAREEVDEVKIEFLVPDYLAAKVLNAVEKLDYYEEKPYGIINLKNKAQNIGAGMVGFLENPMKTLDFLELLKTKMGLECIRHTELIKENIAKVALCGGSGSFLLNNAIAARADIYISADFKYHEFFDADKQLIIADIGHYESEQYTSELFHELLTNKFPNFAIRFSGIVTNPIKYYK